MATGLRGVVKKIAGVVFGDYRLNRIYTLDLGAIPDHVPVGYTMRRLEQDDVAHAAEPTMRARAWYGGQDAIGFGVWDDGGLVCLCWFWNHRRFADTKIWSLRHGEAIMVDLLTVDRCRGRGLASALMPYAALELKRAGYQRLYAWVWHTNVPSIRSFEKTGWRYIAHVTELHPFGMTSSLRFVRRRT